MSNIEPFRARRRLSAGLDRAIAGLIDVSARALHQLLTVHEAIPVEWEELHPAQQADYREEVVTACARMDLTRNYYASAKAATEAAAWLVRIPEAQAKQDGSRVVADLCTQYEIAKREWLLAQSGLDQHIGGRGSDDDSDNDE